MSHNIGTFLAIVANIGHQPLFTFTEDGGTVYLVIIVLGRNHKAILVRCLHLVVDSLHRGLRNAVSETADYTKERKEYTGYFLHICLFLEQPVDLIAGSVDADIAGVNVAGGEAGNEDNAFR